MDPRRHAGRSLARPAHANADKDSRPSVAQLSDSRTLPSGRLPNKRTLYNAFAEARGFTMWDAIVLRALVGYPGEWRSRTMMRSTLARHCNQMAPDKLICSLEHLERHGWLTRTRVSLTLVRYDVRIGQGCDCGSSR